MDKTIGDTDTDKRLSFSEEKCSDTTNSVEEIKTTDEEAAVIEQDKATTEEVVVEQGEIVRVFLRLRPHVDEESGEMVFTKADDDALIVTDDKTVQAVAPEDSQSFKNREIGGQFEYTHVYDKATKQEELFESTTSHLVERLVLEGQDGLLFAYGVTNAGKTFTVEGTDENPGIIPRTLQLVFDKLQERENNEENFDPLVEISYLQIYNEEVHDLQAVNSKSGNLLKEKLKIKLRDDGVEVEGLKSSSISNCKEGLEILEKGRDVRETHETQCNLSSSRSHSVFAIQVYFNKASKASGSRPARLYIVDLAGSERAKRTLASRARQREASNINCSLMNLMRCLDTLRYNQKNPKRKPKMVPFRESKLTLLFRDCFVGGNCGGVVMIVNASSRPDDYDETAHALKYGALVKNVRVQRMKTRGPSSAKKYGFDGRRIPRPGTGSKSKAQQQNKNNGSRGGGNDSARKGSLLPEDVYQVDVDDMDAGGLGLGVDDHPVIHALVYELADARMRAVSLEAEIRQEVAEEMARYLEEMESVFRKRLDSAKKISDNKAEMLMKNLRRRMEESGKEMYSLQDIEALVEGAKESQGEEEEEEKLNLENDDDVKMLKKEVNQLKLANAEASESAKAERRKSAEAVRRESFERIVDQIDSVTRYKEELSEERALHEKTIKQLESATQLAKDAQIGEAEAERQVVQLKLEIDQLKAKISKSNRSKESSPGGSVFRQMGSPRLPLRTALSRKASSRLNRTKTGGASGAPHTPEPTSKLAMHSRTLRNHSSAPALDETWRLDQEIDAENDQNGLNENNGNSKNNNNSSGDEKHDSFKSDGSRGRGLMSRMVSGMRKW